MKTNPEKLNYWQRQIEGLKSSGLTRRAYCEGNGIKLSTLDYWCQKLSPSERENKKAADTGWIPLRLSDDGSYSGIEMRIGQITIAVKPGFDQTLLTELLRTIGALC
jgi:hypothetical protein